MTWRKLGRIFDYSGNAIEHHMQCPTVLVMDMRLRIFYADRDEQNRSFIAYIDVDRENPRKSIFWHGGPIIERGAPGTFDDCGQMPSCVFQHEGQTFMYYSGWNKGVTTPYHNAIGLAVSQDSRRFERMFNGPVMDRSSDEPYMAVTPFVHIEKLTWRRRMWYVSTARWVAVDGHLEPVYHIRHAYSLDGVDWVRDPKPCIAPAYELEAFSNPSVIVDKHGYRMWFSSRDSHDYRGGDGSYRIGSAKSKDGLTWERTDDGLNVSADGWDSEMTAYPYVVSVDGRLLLFSNGNGFGRSGIGVSEWMD